jgi:hypothetical protein
MKWTTLKVDQDAKDEFNLLYNVLKKKGYGFTSQNDFFKYLLADFMKRNNIVSMMIEFNLPKEFEEKRTL